MAAAEHGATFHMAEKVRASMTLKQLSDFASGSQKGKPEHVKKRQHGKNLGGYLHAPRTKRR